MHGIIGRRMYETWHQMDELLASGRLDISPAITHVMPMEDYAAAMEQLKSGSAGKIVLVPWGETATGTAGRRAGGARGAARDGRRDPQPLRGELEEIRAAGLWKDERVIAGPQGPEVTLADGRRVLVFCANNYLGLSSDPRVVAAAHATLDSHGYGLSSVRFICGTQDLHKQLEARIARFLHVDDSILFAAAFDANGGVFEPLLGEEDAIVSDELNHASLIDGDSPVQGEALPLPQQRPGRPRGAARGGAGRGRARRDDRHRRRVLDGRLDRRPGGHRARWPKKHRAMTLVDDCHATGFLGATGRGATEHCGVLGEVDFVTGTLGKALGGAIGGFVAGRGPAIALLRQRARPYLFSNTLMPAIVGASLAVLRPARLDDRAARPPGREHGALPRGPHRARLRREARRAPDRPHHALRRAPRARPGAPPARRGHLRDRLQLPGGAEGPGADPRPGLGRPHARTPGPRAGGVREGRA